MIKERIAQIRKNIDRICHSSGRSSDSIVIVAVTKYTTVENIKEAVRAGITDIGENRIQDAAKKFSELDGKVVNLKRHMIGHLQTNKAKDAVELFDMVQSVDSVKIAKAIDKESEKIHKVMDVLLQVNSSLEERKSGIHPDQLMNVLDEVSALKNIRICGLMTIGPLTENRNSIRSCFQLTKNLFDEAGKRLSGQKNSAMKILSMGMTNDYDIALECGANMVRIGSAIFA
ncbi:MAG: YggS family pyridoxal phosphate-dependent enzyme [Candidatus Omnitrophota bacterium]